MFDGAVFDGVQWGTIGEWFGGIGAFAAAAAAVSIARRGSGEATRNLDRQLEAARNRDRRERLTDALVDYIESAGRIAVAAELVRDRRSLPRNGPSVQISDQRLLRAVEVIDSESLRCERSRLALQRLGLRDELPGRDSDLLLEPVIAPSLTLDPETAKRWREHRANGGGGQELDDLLEELRLWMLDHQTAALRCLGSVEHS